MMGEYNNIELSIAEVKKDVDLIFWSTKLSNLYRFTHQRYWEEETIQNQYAIRIEGLDTAGNKIPRAESVAEHSWHIADIALIIAPRFQELNLEKCLLISILHDKLEIITGDKNPLGKNGKGTKTHAFNSEKRASKNELEKEALEKYLSKLNEYTLNIQKSSLLDTLSLASIESKFIKAIDKIHPLIYIIRKKRGKMLDDHIIFTLRYSRTYFDYFPQLEPYYNEILDRLFIEISNYRKCDVNDLRSKFHVEQLDLFNN